MIVVRVEFDGRPAALVLAGRCSAHDDTRRLPLRIGLDRERAQGQREYVELVVLVELRDDVELALARVRRAAEVDGRGARDAIRWLDGGKAWRNRDWIPEAHLYERLGLLVGRPVIGVESIDHVLGGCDIHDIAELTVHRNAPDVERLSPNLAQDPAGKDLAEAPGVHGGRAQDGLACIHAASVDVVVIGKDVSRRSLRSLAPGGEPADDE